MNVEQLYTGCLAQGAYYIVSGTEAVIIDPLRETSPYLKKLKEDGVKLKYIFETHFHADFVSGHVDLAKKTGAEIVYGPNAKTDFDIHQVADGDILTVGNISFEVLHTPGHTLESTTYLLKDESGKDHAIFTGDTLFIGDVGRPDLAQKSGEMTMEDLAGLAYDSLRNKIMPLSDDVIVYPAHGAGSACGKNMSKERFDTLGNQKKFNYALRADMTKAEFISEVTDGLAPPPYYFAQNAKLNKTGYQNIDSVLEKGAISLSVEKFKLLHEAHDALLLDTRHKDAFAQAHIPNSIFIGIDGSFAPWVGALILDINQPILIIAEKGREEEVVMRLARVGYDNTLGYLDGGIENWQQEGNPVDSIESISADTFAQRYQVGNLNSLDVRNHGEYNSEKLDDSISMPLGAINNRMHELKFNEFYHIHCGSGYRSVIAASILKSRGFGKVVNVEGGMQSIKNTNLEILYSACELSK